MNMQEIIQQLPMAIGAEIVECRPKGFLSDASYEARLKFKNWPMTIKFGTIPARYGSYSYMMITAAFHFTDDFKFTVSYKKYLSMFKKHIAIGYPELAGRNVLTETNDGTKLETILQNSKVHELLVKILDHNPGSILTAIPEWIRIIKKDKNVNVLQYEKRNIMTTSWDENIDIFKNVCELFKEILLQLVEIGSASEE